MENNAVIKNGVGNISQAELAAMKEQMNHKALVRRRTKTALRLAANIMVGAVIFTSAFVCGQHRIHAVK